MNKQTGVAIAVIAAAVIAVGGWFWYAGTAKAPTQAPGIAADYKNGTYLIDGQAVTLVGGRASTPAAPGSASQVVTQYFGNEATGDLNGDGTPDTAFILTQSGGGSGIFYYVVAALKTAGGYQGTNAVLLGDRVAPQTTQISGGEVVANYAERKAGEPMTTQPSVGVSKYLRIVAGTLVEVAHPNQ